MQRLAALLAIAVLAAACGDGDEKTAPTTAAAPATTAAVVPDATTEQAPATTAELPPATSSETPPVSTTGTEPVPPEMANVVLAWSDALNRNDNETAARYFAPGAIIRQSQEYRLDDAEIATTWNDGLPCAGEIVELRMVDIAVVAIFVLGERPGHQCDAPGARAAAAFVIEDGLIVLWQQVAVPDEGTPITPTPDETATETAPVA
jgi:limonene-1,2-epoxide hydrolase